MARAERTSQQRLADRAAYRAMAALHADPNALFGRWSRPDELDVVTSRGRPGDGGRPAPRGPSRAEAARQELEATFGQSRTFQFGQGRIEYFELDPQGDGAAIVRMSSQDIQKGETAAYQAERVLEVATRDGHKPRWLVVGLRVRSTWKPHERPDFEFLRQRIELGQVKWVSFLRPARIARKGLPREWLIELLTDEGIDLYLYDLGRKVHFANDLEYLLVNGLVDQLEHRNIVNRLAEGKYNIRVKSGRGHGSELKVGFRESKLDGFPEIDPVQWPFIRHCHIDLASLNDGGPASLSEMATHLTDMGFTCDKHMVRQILTNPIYVDGEWEITWNGRKFPGRRIELGDHAIPRNVFERNQLIVNRKRGKAVKTPSGHFLLAGIDIFHDRCAHQRDSKGRTPRLAGRRYTKLHPEDPGHYAHVAPIPDSCKRWTIQAIDLETLIVEQLLALAETPALQLAWAQSAAGEHTQDSGLLTDEALAELKTQMRNLGRRIDQNERDYVQAAKDNGDLGLTTLIRVQQALDAELHAMQRRLDLHERLAGHADQRNHRQELLLTLRDVLTPEIPDEPDKRLRRNLIARALISKVIVQDDDDGGVSVQLFGPLIPEDSPTYPADPIADAGTQIDPDSQPLEGRTTRRRLRKNVRPGWISPALRSGAPNRRYLRDVLVRADGRLPPGLLHRGAWRGLTDPVLPSWLELRLLLDRLEVGLQEAVEEALDQERLLWGRRKRSVDAADLEAMFAIRLAALGADGVAWASPPGRAAREPPGLPYTRGAIFCLAKNNGVSVLGLWRKVGGRRPGREGWDGLWWTRDPRVRRARRRLVDLGRVEQELESALACDDVWPSKAEWKVRGLDLLLERARAHRSTAEWCVELGLSFGVPVERAREERVREDLRALFRMLRPETFPPRAQLLRLLASSRVADVYRTGGPGRWSEELGVPLARATWKRGGVPRRWTDATVADAVLAAAVDGVRPSYRLLVEVHGGGIAPALNVRGGLRAVAASLGLREPERRWDEAKVRAAYRDLAKRLGRRPAVRDVKALGEAGLVEAIRRYSGGLPALWTSLGLGEAEASPGREGQDRLRGAGPTAGAPAYCRRDQGAG